MRVATISALCSVIVLCGCATNRTFRPTGPANSGGSSAPLDLSPSLGDPAPTINGQDGSSSFGPSRSGPILGSPEARRDDALSRGSKTAQLEAPHPKSHSSRARSEVIADQVSSSDRPSISRGPRWNRSDRSTDLRPIESMILGSGHDRIAILSSLHGDENQSVGLIEELSRFLRGRPELLRNATVLLVKSPNPDGLAVRSPYNTRGVDLNRNFPSANWKELRNTRAGVGAASEVETRALMRILADFEPTLLVHVKESRGAGAVNCEGDVQTRAEQIAGLISCQVVQGLGEKTSGSVESYALTKLACPSLTLLLTREANDEAAWTKNRDVLLTLISESRASSESGDVASALDSEPDPFEQPAVYKSSLRRQRPGDANPHRSTTADRPGNRAKLPDFPAPVPEKGYLELPPP